LQSVTIFKFGCLIVKIQPLVQLIQDYLRNFNYFLRSQLWHFLGGWIYDASGGQVDVDDDPDYGPPHTARDLDGDDKWGDYKYRVIDGYPPSTFPRDYGFDVE